MRRGFLRGVLAAALLALLAPGALAQQISVGMPLSKASGGTGGTTGLAAAQNLSHAYVLCSDATQHPMGTNTAQTVLATCVIPANALSAGSVVRIGHLWSFTGNTDTKIFQFWLNSSPILPGGTQMFGTSTASASITTLSGNQTLFVVRDASTEINNNSFWGGFSAQTMTIVNYSTTSALYIFITGTQTTTADNLALEHYVVEILPPGGN